MLRTYFKTAYRTLIRNRSYSIINMIGLAIGVAIFLSIFMIIRYESSFDKFHQKKDRIYRVLTEYHHADAANIFFGAGVPLPTPSALRRDFPQVEKSSAVYSETNQQFLITNGAGQVTKKFKEQAGVFYLEPSFFEIFDFPWLAGTAATALKDPNSTVLSRSTAIKYFGDWPSAMGKVIRLNNHDDLKVTGIIEDAPANTDFNLRVIISLGTGYTARFAASTDWNSTGSSYGCYLLLAPNTSIASFNEQLRNYVKKLKDNDNKDSHIVQSLAQVHLDTTTGNFSGKSISQTMISALWMIGAFILLIACVNFINLSTAQAVNRSKEVGVRKVLGSNKTRLRLQFITETFLTVLTAVVLAIIITLIAMPGVNKVLGAAVPSNAIMDLPMLLFIPALIVIVTFLAGFYPSLVLSGFNPIQALRSKLVARAAKGITLRRSLVVFQFIIAQALIIGMLFMVKQMTYFTGRPLGFNKAAIVNIPIPGDSAGATKLDDLRKQLEGTSGIAHVSFNSNTPVEDDNDNWSTFKFDHALKETQFYAIQKWTDHEYQPTFELPLIAGRNLQPSDTAKEFLVNELLLKNLGIKDPQQALNKEISMWDDHLKGNIVGVLKDFNSRSFRRDMAPVLMTSDKRGYTQAGIKLNSPDVHGTMKAIEKIWQNVYPDYVFEYQFMDAKVESFYRQEAKLSLLYKIFAFIAIILGCLGLYGLASFMAVQRIKEVGIRKVLGASAAEIVYLFSKEFIVLIAIAFLIATPLAWYFMHRWLQDYPYRIHLDWWVFGIGGLLSVVLAELTLCFQAVKAAIANPVKSLRTE